MVSVFFLGLGEGRGGTGEGEKGGRCFLGRFGVVVFFAFLLGGRRWREGGVGFWGFELFSGFL